MDYSISMWAAITGLVFGLVMPVLANYLPIKAVMGQNLRNSLDLNRRTEDQFGVKMQKLEDVGMSTNQILMSIMLVGIGFSTFYCIPLCFVKGKTTLFFLILQLVLFLIVIGLAFIATLVFSRFEKLILWCGMHSCCRRDKRMYHVVIKNMEAHRKRNLKTSTMFTLALSFLIFSASTFNLMSKIMLDVGE